MQADARKIDELRRRRETAVSEVKDAERELLTVKTSVEDAEAVYNNVRSQPAGFHVDHHHGHDESHMNVDEGHDHHDDWDKFLDFGDGDDKTTGEPGAKSPARTGPRHSQGAGGTHAAPRMSEGTDPVSRAAAAASAAEDVQSPAAAAAMRDATVAAVRVTAAEPTHANHHRYQPSLHEAEQFLLQELKKLEAANARLMSARAHLEVIDRQLAAAIASAAERSEQRVAMMRRNPALVAGPVKKTWGGPPGARAKASIAEVVEEDEDDDEEDGGTKKTTGRRNTAAAAGASAGGKVIEDRRFGIYDSRRYRMEGEPAPPDPSSDEDDEPRVGRGRGRGAKSGSAPKASSNAPKSVKSAKVTPVSADAVSIGVAGRGRGRGVAGGRGRGRPPKNPRPPVIEPEEIVSTKAGTNLKRHQGFQFRGQGGGASGFVAPSASDAATYIARAGTHGLQWRMKRPRTRSGVSRPASGPTSWAGLPAAPRSSRRVERSPSRRSSPVTASSPASAG